VTGAAVASELREEEERMKKKEPHKQAVRGEAAKLRGNINREEQELKRRNGEVDTTTKRHVNADVNRVEAQVLIEDADLDNLKFVRLNLANRQLELKEPIQFNADTIDFMNRSKASQQMAEVSLALAKCNAIYERESKEPLRLSVEGHTNTSSTTFWFQKNGSDYARGTQAGSEARARTCRDEIEKEYKRLRGISSSTTVDLDLLFKVVGFGNQKPIPGGHSMRVEMRVVAQGES